MEETVIKSRFCRYLKWSLAGFGLLALLVNGGTLLIHYYAVSGHGSWGTPSLDLVLWFCLGVVILSVVTVAGLFLNRLRAVSLAVFLGCVLYVGLNLMTLVYADNVRMAGFKRLAERSQPLINAIEAYTEAHGMPPQELTDLSLAPTELSADGEPLPDFQLISGYRSLDRFHGNPWVLVLDTPTGLFNWDRFVYYPQQNYPSLSNTGYFELVNGWAYIHQ